MRLALHHHRNSTLDRVSAVVDLDGRRHALQMKCMHVWRQSTVSAYSTILRCDAPTTNLIFWSSFYRLLSTSYFLVHVSFLNLPENLTSTQHTPHPRRAPFRPHVVSPGSPLPWLLVSCRCICAHHRHHRQAPDHFPRNQQGKRRHDADADTAPAPAG